jgi:uncharacterized protein YndB with AHSA1/START domain/uncharacterized protein YciI
MPLPPLRREIVVAADPARAFAVFTEEISAWWPLAELSVLGSGSLVSFEDGRLIEANAGGEQAIWGEVREWEPGRRLRFSWHPGREVASEVAVTFTATEAGTQVVLEHSGWEVYADPQQMRSEYGEGWPTVLLLYAESIGIGESESTPAQETWVALMHVPGPSAPTDSSLFADPRFGEHVAFLQRTSERGYLVAAGSFGTDGSGMTILRLPGGERLAEATVLAMTDDRAVTSGLLAVSVRPWNVMLHSLD